MNSEFTGASHEISDLNVFKKTIKPFKDFQSDRIQRCYRSGADPGFFLGGGALVSCYTSTPINHIVFFFAEYQLY